ncbi:HRSL1 enzyme, partial [Cinclus mexicanus]|nr:HRSL1 enzyme [Cinclus mexicanus]
ISSLPYTGKQKVKRGPQKVPVFTRMVKKQRLKKVVRTNKWRVNNESDQHQTPLPVKEIITRAVTFMGKEMTYYSYGRNCEHFVKKLRYGEAVSEQVSDT